MGTLFLTYSIGIGDGIGILYCVDYRHERCSKFFAFTKITQNTRVQTLKEGLTSVYYMHLSLHSSLIRPKVCYLHSRT